MRKKQARQGKFAGRFFYGCTRWPNCNGIVNIGNDGATAAKPASTSQRPVTVDNRPYANIATLLFPVNLSARPRAQGHKTLFMDSLALPQDLLTQVNIKEDFFGFIEQFTKWRIDFTPADIELDKKQSTTLSVIEKIVNRGRVTRLSEKLEQNIRKINGVKSSVEYSQEIINNTYKKYHTPIIPVQWHDGEKRHNLDDMTAEEYFYKKILIDIIGKDNVKDVLPQVFFGSLVIDKRNVSNAILSQRVDFLVTHNRESIVIEIDDPTHSNHKQKDRQRDKILDDNGLKTYRITIDELVKQDGDNLSKLIKKLKEMYEPVASTKKIYPHLLSIKLAHQLQLLLIELVKCGKINPSRNTRVDFRPENLPYLEEKMQKRVLDLAIADLVELDIAISRLYSSRRLFEKVSISSDEPDIVISVNDNYDYEQSKIIYIQDISFPLRLEQNTWESINYVVLQEDEAAIKFLLKYIFRFSDFRPNQIDGIIQSIQGDDSIVLLPTGSGKSIIYQLLSFIMPGMSIVVDPIVSLIEDQVDNLRRVGIDRVIGITSSTENKDKVQLAIANGQYAMAFVSPERFQIESFRNSLSQYCAKNVVAVCAIDEAHCVSEWGHDFRTSYLNLAKTCRRLLKTGLREPPIIALTGTASEAVLRDMERDLAIDDSFVIRPESFDRKEIEFVVVPSISANKGEALRSIIETDLPKRFGQSKGGFYAPNREITNSGIIFCMHVGGQFGVRQILSNVISLGIEAEEYFGQQTKNTQRMSDEEWGKKKQLNAKRFKDNKFPILVSTKSFGMGIDKPNIRFTIHYGLPQSIEAYYQEAGRAGRDRQKAYSYIILSNDFPDRNSRLLYSTTTIDELVDVSKGSKEADDVTRALWFHANSFSGIEKELSAASNILNKIGDFNVAREITIAAQQSNRENIEKIIYRLSVLGIVKDYTINFATNEFNVNLAKFDKKKIGDNYGEYVRGYQYNDQSIAMAKQRIASIDASEQKVFILKCLRVLLEEFIYTIIEHSRRRAFHSFLEITNKALQISNESQRSKFMRKEILKYLGNTYVDEIKQIVESPDDLNQVQIIIKNGNRKKHDKLYAEIGRTLEAYPHHPGLLLARVNLQLRIEEHNIADIVDSLCAAVQYGIQKYGLPINDLADGIVGALASIENAKSRLYDKIINELIQRLQIKEFEFALFDKLPQKYQYVPMISVLSRVSNDVYNSIRKENLWISKK